MPVPIVSPVTFGLSITVHEYVVPKGIMELGGTLVRLTIKVLPLQIVWFKLGIIKAGTTVTVTVKGPPNNHLQSE